MTQSVSKASASLLSCCLFEQDSGHGCKRKTKQMSGDSTAGKYPEQAILYKQKCDWRAGEGEGGRESYCLVVLFY